MSLTEAQITDLSKLIGENYPATRSALPVVTAALDSDEVAAIEAELGALITEYNRVENKHLRMSGGKDGLDLDFDRDRLSLQKRARVLLGMSPVSTAQTAGDPNALQFFTYRGARW